MRVVGTHDRSEFELDPAVAWRRGQSLDRLGRQLVPRQPHGVQRATHREFNRIDDERARALAQRVSDGRRET